MTKFIKSIIIAGVAFMAVSCGEFLNRPTIDGYNTSNFYQNDAQVEQGVNYLYNSPWYDFQRGFIKVGEVMSGNMYWGSSPYLSLTANGTDADLMNMSYSLWSVNAHCNTVIKNILESTGTASQAAKDHAIGEALTLKALAYFFLVRTFGEVPIVHDNAELLGAGEYNTVKKADRASVYEYIIMTLEKAMTLLPKNAYIGKYNRIDYYAAEGLLAKVYLTKAGLSGSLNAADLAKAAECAEDVIKYSGRELTPKYSDVFRLSPTVFNATGEPLISWQWAIDGGQWTRQNTLQSDLIWNGFSDHGDCWGGWGGPSVDLCDAFGVATVDNPAVRAAEADSRRQACIMMPGDFYDYFWQNKVDPVTGRTGFNFIVALHESTEYAKGGPGEMQCGTGTNNVKHLYGNDYDHTLGVGKPADRMAYQLPTHILRLSDVYLVYAEALVDTDPAEALIYLNKVRSRAGVPELSAITRETVWKERRLELAGEGDYWYDFVRRSYFQPEVVIAEIKAQRRSTYNGDLKTVYKQYYESDLKDWNIILLTEPDGQGGVSGWQEGVEGQVWYGKDGKVGNDDAPNVTIDSFTLPFPTEDVVFNGNMASNVPGEPVNVRELYKYNF